MIDPISCKHTESMPHTSPSLDGRPRHTSIATMLVMAMVAVLALAGCGLIGDGGDNVQGPEQPTFSYVIPAGSGDLIARGEDLGILPRSMETKVGETIQIVNQDSIPHVLGPWFVGPGETLRQRFVTPGVYEGSCSVHPDGAFTVTVAEA